MHLEAGEAFGGGAAGGTKDVVEQSGVAGGAAEDDGFELGVDFLLCHEVGVQDGKGVGDGGDGDGGLGDSVDGRGLIGVDGGNAVVLLVEDQGQELLNLVWDGSREAHALPASSLLLGDLLQDSLDGGGKPLVEHAVCLVKDHAAELGEFVSGFFFGEVVDEAAGGGDEDGGFAIEEPPKERVLGGAAYGNVALERLSGELVTLIGNLLGQLAGGGEDEDCNELALQVWGGHDVLEGGEQESDCLASSGLGLYEAVVLEAGHLQDLFLHWGHVCEAHLLDILEELGRNATLEL